MRFDIVLATGDRLVALGAGEDVLAVKTFSLNSLAAVGRMAASVSVKRTVVDPGRDREGC